MGKARGGGGAPDAEAVYDAIAEAWARTRSGPWPEVTSFLASMPRGARVIDVGAGSGRYLQVHEAAGLRVAGVDVSRGLLAVARRTVPRAELMRGDARSLPVKGRAADGALVIAVVHHFDHRTDRLRAAAEACRALKVGGRALFSAWGAEAEVFAGARPLEGGGPRDFLVPFKEQLRAPVDRFFHAYEVGELAAEAREAGFSAVREWTARENRFVEAAR